MTIHSVSAAARRLYMHAKGGGKVSSEDLSRLVVMIELLEGDFSRILSEAHRLVTADRESEEAAECARIARVHLATTLNSVEHYE